MLKFKKQKNSGVQRPLKKTRLIRKTLRVGILNLLK